MSDLKIAALEQLHAFVRSLELTFGWQSFRLSTSDQFRCLYGRLKIGPGPLAYEWWLEGGEDGVTILDATILTTGIENENSGAVVVDWKAAIRDLGEPAEYSVRNNICFAVWRRQTSYLEAAVPFEVARRALGGMPPELKITPLDGGVWADVTLGGRWTVRLHAGYLETMDRIVPCQIHPAHRGSDFDLLPPSIQHEVTRTLLVSIHSLSWLWERMTAVKLDLDNQDSPLARLTQMVTVLGTMCQNLLPARKLEQQFERIKRIFQDEIAAWTVRPCFYSRHPDRELYARATLNAAGDAEDVDRLTEPNWSTLARLEELMQSLEHTLNETIRTRTNDSLLEAQLIERFQHLYGRVDEIVKILATLKANRGQQRGAQRLREKIEGARFIALHGAPGVYTIEARLTALDQAEEYLATAERILVATLEWKALTGQHV